MKEIERMTPAEYALRMKSQALRENDETQQIYLVGLVSRLFTATNKKGDQYLFNDVSDLYDYEKVEKKIFGNHENQAQRNDSDQESLYEQHERLERAKALVAAKRKGG